MGEETKSELSDRESKHQEEEKHPEEWEQDLNPNRMAGQNIGARSDARESAGPTAYDVKDLHERLEGYTDDELKKISMVPEGMRLQQGATYIDLQSEELEEFTAMGQETAGSDNTYVPKEYVPYELWNRLIGESEPEEKTHRRSTKERGTQR